MKSLNGIKTGLICTASALTIGCVVGYIIVGGWHLLLLAIVAGVVGLTLKDEEEL